jgi:hypothetical protein
MMAHVCILAQDGVEDCSEWGIYVANGAVRCVVSKNSVEGCSTTDAFTEAVGTTDAQLAFERSPRKPSGSGVAN